jgi:hypothetical protein
MVEYANHGFLIAAGQLPCAPSANRSSSGLSYARDRIDYQFFCLVSTKFSDRRSFILQPNESAVEVLKTGDNRRGRRCTYQNIRE